MAALVNRTKSLTVAASVEEAKSYFARLRGLLGRRNLAAGTTLWLEPCDSIHTFFMKFSIDAVFVDRDLVVCKVVRNIPPWRLLTPVAHARSVFEFGAGQASPDRVGEGDQLHVGS